jgi:cellulose synthase/poly-beta-1,6-N-acetylglucosamine synthase-like glycosyltransferase
MDFTVRLHRYCIENKIPFKIIFIPDPVCWTQVPDSWRFLIRQRDRWRRGLIDVLLYNFRMSFNPRYKTAGMVGFPYFILVEFLGPIIEFIGYVLIPVLLIFKLLNTQFAIIFFFVAILWGIFITIGSILMDNLLFVRYESLKDVFKLILFAFFEFVFYKELLAFVAFFATFRFRARKWGHIPRKKMEKTV